MKNTELRDLRLKIKFSMADFALCVGVPKSTYQRYEDGSAAIPPAIERAALELEKINIQFNETSVARIDARIAREFPHGIASEGKRDRDER